MAASTQNQALSALLFLYREVLGGDLHGALQLKLVKTKIFGSGVVLNYYQPIYPK